MVSLAHPLALLLLPLLGVALWLGRRRPGPALGLPDGRAAQAAAAGPGLAWLPGACRLAGAVLAALALAGPGIGPQSVLWRGRGVDIMLVVDLSETMAAMDFHQGNRSITRLAAVAEEVARFAAARPGDRIGLVAFGSRAYTVLPPTDDQTALTRALATLNVGAAGKRTALGDGLALGVKRLRDAPGRSRVLVLFSDGRSNTGEISPEQAAAVAAAQGVTIQAVGIGSEAPAPFLIDHPLLGPEIVQEKADIDEAALRRLAEATGGLFWRAEDAAGLAEAIRRVGTMAPSDMVAMATGKRISLTPPLAALAGLALAAFALLSGTRFTRLP
jgi:Ca-activated chloride channel homolog